MWELNPGHVHCWVIDIPSFADSVATFHDDLSEDERRRAARFVRDRDRLQYVVCRSVVRRLLARYASSTPASLSFGYSCHGKPFLPKEINPGEIQFNLAHSGDMAAVAVARTSRVGIDVEKINVLAQLDHFIRGNFSPVERLVLEALCEAERLQAFFKVWVRKEAFVKATGEGLSRPLHSFSVVTKHGTAPPVIQIDSADAIASAWTLCDLELGEGYAAAVAVASAGATIDRRRFSLELTGFS